MTNLLFLDIDGVLNSTRYWSDNKPLPMGRAGAIDPEAVERLNQIVDRTGCFVVLSSSWRLNNNWKQVQTMMRERGWKHCLQGATPNFPSQPRFIEIAHVIERANPDRFVVLDDDPDAFHVSLGADGCFVNTNYLVGLQDDGVAMACAWLGDAA